MSHVSRARRTWLRRTRKNRWRDGQRVNWCDWGGRQKWSALTYCSMTLIIFLLIIYNYAHLYSWIFLDIFTDHCIYRILPHFFNSLLFFYISISWLLASLSRFLWFHCQDTNSASYINFCTCQIIGLLFSYNAVWFGIPTLDCIVGPMPMFISIHVHTLNQLLRFSTLRGHTVKAVSLLIPWTARKDECAKLSIIKTRKISHAR